jgi:hypothetical protein
MFSPLLTTLFTIYVSAMQLSRPSPQPVAIPLAVMQKVQSIDEGIPAMRKEEGERPTEWPVTAYFEGVYMRKIDLGHGEEAYYLERGRLIYARKDERKRRTEAVFEEGRLVLTLANGRRTADAPQVWEDGVTYAQDVLREEAEFRKKPTRETGAELSKTDAATAELDKTAASIDAQHGSTTTKAVWGMSTEGAELVGLSVKGQLLRVTMRVYGESSQSSTTYYLRNDKPFLLVETGYDYTIPLFAMRSRVGGFQQRKYYFLHEDGGVNTFDSVDKTELALYREILARPEDDVSMKLDAGALRIDTTP